jgi:hypothetical protein
MPATSSNESVWFIAAGGWPGGQVSWPAAGQVAKCLGRPLAKWLGRSHLGWRSGGLLH